MSCGFARRPPFQLLAAVDAEQGKPSQGCGRLDCNATYAANIGVEPYRHDLSTLTPVQLFTTVATSLTPPLRRGDLTVLLSCPPCTGFSRAKPTNHSVASPSTRLVLRCAEYVEAFFPEFVIIENARELITGNHTHLYRRLVNHLQKLKYEVKGDVYILTKYGLPQMRERALVVASRIGPVKTLDDLWQGWELRPGATTVRHAIGALNRRALAAGDVHPRDPMHQAPRFASTLLQRRIAAIPPDGGSWIHLADHPEAAELLIPSMKKRLAIKNCQSHSDVYGRLAWDRPAVTIKRECAHVGNGRYVHPEQNRLLTVREMSLLQGFPRDYTFVSASLRNRYRHIGDSVPPLISYQLSALVSWMKTGVRPEPLDWILPGTSLKVTDVCCKPNKPQPRDCAAYAR